MFVRRFKQLGSALFSATGSLSSHGYLAAITLTLKPLFSVHVFSRMSGDICSITLESN